MKKTEFDPYRWARDEYCEEPQENAGELLGSVILQSEAIIKENNDDKQLQEFALRVLNLAATTMQADWAKEESGLSEEIAHSIRRTIVTAYVLGEQASLLRSATSQSDEQLIDDIGKKLASQMGRHAADIRHSKPGGSRDLRDKIRSIWATGKYTSKDICAEQEWEDIGFKSFSTARKALRNA
ncbi:hypothetical protein R5R73_07365 [Salinicola sp. LHM]|uniref:hypothetical protein n=1 Tax=Salinicola sp. LHM TaxID=3065298 RepID=UPI002ACE9825|nr:hypothetical protein [Salinicola sp. LHM]WQH34499.1 hypothetical protein R5R73_07365 [Salinicola sp. LHM]